MNEDNRIKVCPIIRLVGNQFHKDEYVPVLINGQRGKYGTHIEEVQTVGALLDSMGVEDQHHLNRDDFVVWKYQTKGVYCSGECVMAFGIPKESVSMWAGITTPTTTLVYISLKEDGRLVTAIPG